LTIADLVRLRRAVRKVMEKRRRMAEFLRWKQERRRELLRKWLKGGEE